MTSNIESFDEYRNYRNSSSYNGTNYNHNTKLASSVEKILDSNEEESKSTEKKKQRRASLTDEERANKTEKQRQHRSNLTDEERTIMNNKQRQYRANLSDEERAIINQKKRQYQTNLSDDERTTRNEKQRQYRANLSDEERAIRNEKQRQYRANLSEEKKAIMRAKNANHQRQYVKAKQSDPEWRENKRLRNNAYKRAKYAEMVAAERLLLHQKQHYIDSNATEEEAIVVENESEFAQVERERLEQQELQVLANKRRQLLDAHREYKRTNKQWLPIMQTWDEQNPCRYRVLYIWRIVIMIII